MGLSAQYHGIAPTPFPGLRLGLVADEFHLTCIDFLWDGAYPNLTSPSQSVSAVVELALRQLDDFFAHRPTKMSAPLAPHGTPFQRRVWQVMGEIPAGQTKQYGELAHVLSTSARAVGGACRANPIPFLIPCHRVVGANSVGGFAGAEDGRLMELKRWLLAHEQGS